MKLTKYDLYLTDVLGTLTNEDFTINQINDYMKNSLRLKKEIEQTYRCSIDDIVKRGKERRDKGERDHPEFKIFKDVWVRAAEIGYESGDIVMDIEQDAREALVELHKVGGRIRLFFSGSAGYMKSAMKGNGLDEVIERYHSDSEVGSKFEPKTYENIAKQAGISLGEMCYVTDSGKKGIKEAEAAVKALTGRVYLVDRAKRLQEGLRNGYVVVRSCNGIIGEEK